MLKRTLVSIAHSYLKTASAEACSLLPRGLHTSTRELASFTNPAQTVLPLKTGRPRVVILGTGWGGAALARFLDAKLWDLTIISPQNHMVFTPLLASTTVGTLETRAVTLPIVDLQKALRQPQNYYYAASATQVDIKEKVVEGVSEDGIKFWVQYDALVVGTGSIGSTFGIPGVEKYAHFLRTAANSMAIRSKLISNWNKANVPGRSIADRDRLLHIVICGGGPTGVEFAGELADFINKDLFKIDPARARDMKITLIEASELLGSFESRLREYAARKLLTAGVQLVKGVVKEVRENELVFESGGVTNTTPFGLCVWSTGVGPTPFILDLPFAKTSRGRLAVNDKLQVLQPLASKQVEESENQPKKLGDVSIQQEETPADQHSRALEVADNVWSLGDCCANVDTPLPALAQVAEQQGIYLAQVLNNHKLAGGDPNYAPDPFTFRYAGSMATVSGHSAIIQLPKKDQNKFFSLTGLKSWILWRSAYITRMGTLKSRAYVATNWLLSLIFGRDISHW